MPWSAQIHTGFHVYGATQDTTRFVLAFDYGILTLYDYIFQCICLASASHIVVLQPHRNKFLWFGLFRVRSPLLTESILFLFLRILRCFTSPRIAQIILFNSDQCDTELPVPGFPIRKSSDQSVRAAPRSLSQLAASFFA
jgi:hypothetical protein